VVGAEAAEATGLVGGVSTALVDTYRGPPVHAPGRVVADLADSIANEAEAMAGIQLVREREELFDPVTSDPTV